MDLEAIDPGRPVLIAGPTASGKSALALRIAEAQGGVIVNADAIQVYANWRILTARPSAEDEARAAHRLYGFLEGTAPYSVGQWLRDLDPILKGPDRPIIVGGTGLYFSALTEGLADIPATTPEMRAEADAAMRDRGHEALAAELDAATRARIDLANPMRVQRAWEVLRMTGRGIADWRDDTPPPRLARADAVPLLVSVPRDVLTARIARRFAAMLDEGALDEARANHPAWSPADPASKAIGAAELMAHLEGRMTLDEAAERTTILTRQFAKRQRTWFRARMTDWTRIAPDGTPAA